MSRTPQRYLYLVSTGTGRVEQVIGIDHLDQEREIIAFEADVRAAYKIDDPATGLTLLDSLLFPLEAEQLERAIYGQWRNSIARVVTT